MCFIGYDSGLNGMSEEEQMRIAIEESMREFEQVNYLPSQEEEVEEDWYTTGIHSSKEPQNKGGEIIKQCSAIVYETCAQGELETDGIQGQLDSDEKDSSYRSKYFVKKEKCNVCDKIKTNDPSKDGKCNCRTDASDCNGNEVRRGKTVAYLNGGNSQPGAFVPKLSSESDFKSMFDDEDFDKGASFFFYFLISLCFIVGIMN